MTESGERGSLQEEKKGRRVQRKKQKRFHVAVQPRRPLSYGARQNSR